MIRPWHRTTLGMLAAALAAAGCADEESTAAGEREHPSLLVTADRKAEIAERLDREPYASILAVLEERAAREYEELDPEVWDHGNIGHNNDTAQANAVLAWLRDDEAAAAKARDFLLRMPTDFETNATLDVNIRMPHVLMSYAMAWDLLEATEWLSPAESADAAARVTTVTAKFFDKFLGNEAVRHLLLGESQNNHPIRTACAIGMVAIAFPEHPLADTWANWAVSELQYLWGDEGRYVQADGGISEGPFYYGFAYGPSVAMFIAMDNAVAPDRSFATDCRNRREVDPWNVTDCVDGEPFTFRNPLHSDRFRQSVEWSINLRLPSGWRAPLGDANFNAFNGGALLTSVGGGGHLRWDWEHTLESSPPMTWGMDLIAHHLIYFDDAVDAVEPPWRNRFLPDAGNAVFRSGWDEQARWLLLVAESGPARKTLHDHVDGTSFSLAAYGDYLLVDPGYYKPDDLNNAVTAHSQSHNVILIDGQGAPDKGLLTQFGDQDALLRNTIDGTALGYAEAHQSYQSTTIERSAVFVRQRYFVVADRLETTASTARTHAWRLGGWAGYDAGGTFEVFDCQGADGCGGHFARDRGGVHVHLASTAPGLEVAEPPYEPLSPPHVEQFDRSRTVQDHGVIDGRVEALAPGYLAVLAPYQIGAAAGSADGPLMVTPLDPGPDAAAWRIETSDGSDVVWLREPTAATELSLPGGAILSSDAELTVIDEAGRFGLIARGSSAALDAAVVVTGDAAAGAVLHE